jgi:hypothetical protein
MVCRVFPEILHVTIVLCRGVTIPFLGRDNLRDDFQCTSEAQLSFATYQSEVNSATAPNKPL